MKARIVSIAIAATLGAGFIAGCGGTSKKDKEGYIDKVNKAQQDFVAEIGKLSQAPGNVDDLKTTISGLADNSDKLAANLNGIKPPDEVKTEHADLVKVLKDFATTMHTQAAAVGSANGDTTKLKAAANKITAASNKIGPDFSAVIDKINKKLGAKGS